MAEQSTELDISTMPNRKRVPLFVIRKRCENQYWNCSAEHGSGWNPGNPKQSFSPSELAAQIGLLAREHWCDVLIIQLNMV